MNMTPVHLYGAGPDTRRLLAPRAAVAAVPFSGTRQGEGPSSRRPTTTTLRPMAGPHPALRMAALRMRRRCWKVRCRVPLDSASVRQRCSRRGQGVSQEAQRNKAAGGARPQAVLLLCW